MLTCVDELMLEQFLAPREPILLQGRAAQQIGLSVAGQEEVSLDMGRASLELESTVALWLKRREATSGNTLCS